ncbi:MAG: NAD(P)/FAD-dependent oxidoreductase [Dehalococcoidia bacterium]
MNSREKTILIIGGGASGMTAAIAAARSGASVTVLEKMDRVGKKILSTGNGRCNLSNIHEGAAYYHGRQPDFAMEVIRHFPPAKALAFFEELGLLCTVEDEGRVYPVCGQASAVLDVLRLEMSRLGVQVHCQMEIKKIVAGKTGLEVRTCDGQSFKGYRVIVCTGGKAAPHTGSDGSGFAILRDLGHTIIDPFPGLVQLNLSAPFLKQADGVRVNATACIVHRGHILREETGELLFTDYGISGIPIFQLSRTAGELLRKKSDVFLELSLFPGLSVDEIAVKLAKRFKRTPDYTLEAALIGCLHKKLIPGALATAGIRDIRTLCRQITAGETRRLASILARWTFPVTGTQGYARAQVTAGGVDTSEIDPITMQSRVVPGLYMAGEVVDIDGDCGGYNLQWAWSSGHVAGHAAVK